MTSGTSRTSELSASPERKESMKLTLKTALVGGAIAAIAWKIVQWWDEQEQNKFDPGAWNLADPVGAGIAWEIRARYGGAN